MARAPIDKLPPELVARIVDLAVEGWPSTVRLRAATLRNLALVARAWVEPAQRALEARVHIDSYGRARAFLVRRRASARPLVLDELVLFFDFAPQDDDFYPLSDLQVVELCCMGGDEGAQIRSLHLRSTLFMAAFDLNLLRLPALRALRHLRLNLPLEVPADFAPLALRLERLSLSAMVDQPASLFRPLLESSQDTLTALDLFVIKSGSPLHERLVAAFPSLPSRLRQISISTHWVALPDSLVDLVASCNNLCTLSLDGVPLEQVLDVVLPRLSITSLVALDLTLPSSFTSSSHAATSFVDRILRIDALRGVRFLTATRRIESASDELPSRREWRHEGRPQPCRPLP
ncbi:uncharacterized protein RHOBADRAFT_46993 [Rhodotorula graminis WP1]|uniref:F-box domain-containing protein n=1 Tax=Rhodotorula graminis (strain WP1) TaxID=578459 RepID=A0A0P9GGX8_RHOGW|nr:uncharacterized protein RHOBADRAFT_46993 [Rhodotorula graminis WP1]KPV72151.1 hypothetical protein RHOBADRAFT_46993 [Rhodotorula graminis WP1]